MSDFTVGAVRFAGSWSLRHAAAQGVARLGVALRARRTRQMLAEMDDRMLSDIGIGRGEALAESSRSMWDLAARR